MPELPEVETVRRGLEPVLAGAAIDHVEQRRADLRFPLPRDFAARLTGRRVERLTRRAKYLLAALDGDEVLAMHLGMSGRFTIERPGANAQKPGEFLHEAGGSPKHDHVIFTMNTGAVVRYNDVRRFGFMTLIPSSQMASHKLFATLGPEPLGGDFTPDLLAAACKDKKTSLKAALLDQRIVAGLGNIYVCEALYRAGLSPRRAPVRSLAVTVSRGCAPAVWSRQSATSWLRRSKRADRPCATIRRSMASLAIFNIHLQSMDARV